MHQYWIGGSAWIGGSVDRGISKSKDRRIDGTNRSLDCSIAGSLNRLIGGSRDRSISGSVDRWISRSKDGLIGSWMG